MYKDKYNNVWFREECPGCMYSTERAPSLVCKHPAIKNEEYFIIMFDNHTVIAGYKESCMEYFKKSECPLSVSGKLFSDTFR